jgi:hypothetical protein
MCPGKMRGKQGCKRVRGKRRKEKDEGADFEGKGSVA